MDTMFCDTNAFSYTNKNTWDCPLKYIKDYLSCKFLKSYNPKCFLIMLSHGKFSAQWFQINEHFTRKNYISKLAWFWAQFISEPPIVPKPILYAFNLQFISMQLHKSYHNALGQFTGNARIMVVKLESEQKPIYFCTLFPFLKSLDIWYYCRWDLTHNLLNLS